jgi:hypothetical protein
MKIPALVKLTETPDWYARNVKLWHISHILQTVTFEESKSCKCLKFSRKI